MAYRIDKGCTVNGSNVNGVRFSEPARPTVRFTLAPVQWLPVNLTSIGLCIVILSLQQNQLDAPMYQIYFILE
jgi:hypothetical protein